MAHAAAIFVPGSARASRAVFGAHAEASDEERTKSSRWRVRSPIHSE